MQDPVAVWSFTHLDPRFEFTSDAKGLLLTTILVSLSKFLVDGWTQMRPLLLTGRHHSSSKSSLGAPSYLSSPFSFSHCIHFLLLMIILVPLYTSCCLVFLPSLDYSFLKAKGCLLFSVTSLLSGLLFILYLHGLLNVGVNGRMDINEPMGGMDL